VPKIVNQKSLLIQYKTINLLKGYDIIIFSKMAIFYSTISIIFLQHYFNYFWIW